MKMTITTGFTGVLEHGQPGQEYKPGDVVEVQSDERWRELEAAGIATREEEVTRPSRASKVSSAAASAASAFSKS